MLSSAPPWFPGGRLRHLDFLSPTFGHSIKWGDGIWCIRFPNPVGGLHFLTVPTTMRKWLAGFVCEASALQVFCLRLFSMGHLSSDY